MNFIDNGPIIYVYLKMGVADEEPLITLVEHCDCKNCYIYSDAKRSNSTYRQIQSQLQPFDIIVIGSLDALSSDANTLYDELLWLQEHQISLIVRDFPSTHITTPKENAIALAAIIDVYGKVLYKTPEANAARSKGGRKSIQYPENWEELYSKWAAKEITALTFMKESGLKKGTFYNMLNDYHNMLTSNQNQAFQSTDSETEFDDY